MFSIQLPARDWPVAFATVAYVLLMLLLHGLGWQHLLLALMLWAALSRNAAAHRFMADWWPMILFWLSYDFMRIYSSSLLARAAVESPWKLEKALFPAPGGDIWPFFFARRDAALHGWPEIILSLGSNLVYLSQLFVIPVLMFLFWLRRSHLFFRLLWPLTTLHLGTLAVYFMYPAAPPWWVYENGLIQPTPEHSFPAGFREESILSQLFHMSPNRFAAIPSLHGAYPFMLFLVLVRGRAPAWSAWTAAGYAACMWFACVYLNQHYIVDLLLGAVLALAALPAGEALLRWKNQRGGF